MGYSDNLVLTSTSGTPNGYMFRMNSVFDPDLTGIGHQPYGHDTLSTIYNAYVVLGFKITVRATASSNCMLTIRPTTSQVSPTNLTLEAERPDSKAIYLTNGESRKVSMYVPAHVPFGRTKSQYLGDDVFRGSVGANPTNISVCNICVQHPDQTSTVASYLNVDIVYYVKWMNKVALAQS